jgi:tryptophan halogenase
VSERWIDPGVQGLRADLCQVQSTREETILLFGTQQPQGAGATGPSARLERRIVLAPAMAKQLATALASVMREYDTQLNATPAGRIQSVATDGDAPAEARPMLALVRGLGVGFGFEKSFKMSRGSLLSDRVILGVRTRLAGTAGLLNVCRGIGMPRAYLEQFEAMLPQANTVGFGFEGSARRGVYKVYLEFWDRLVQRLQGEPENVEPALLFLGFKWAPHGDAAIARYTCYPLLSIKGIRRRLDTLYDNQGPSLQAARDILELAARRVGTDSFVYVEAAEEGNPRRSFDLNFYKAGLRVDELRPALSALAGRYALAGNSLESILAEAGQRAFGHLSGGLGRQGEDFLTVYYEIEGL